MAFVVCASHASSSSSSIRVNMYTYTNTTLFSIYMRVCAIKKELPSQSMVLPQDFHELVSFWMVDQISLLLVLPMAILRARWVRSRLHSTTIQNNVYLNSTRDITSVFIVLRIQYASLCIRYAMCIAFGYTVFEYVCVRIREKSDFLFFLFILLLCFLFCFYSSRCWFFSWLWVYGCVFGLYFVLFSILKAVYFCFCSFFSFTNWFVIVEPSNHLSKSIWAIGLWV